MKKELILVLGAILLIGFVSGVTEDGLVAHWKLDVNEGNETRIIDNKVVTFKFSDPDEVGNAGLYIPGTIYYGHTCEGFYSICSEENIPTVENNAVYFDGGVLLPGWDGYLERKGMDQMFTPSPVDFTNILRGKVTTISFSAKIPIDHSDYSGGRAVSFGNNARFIVAEPPNAPGKIEMKITHTNPRDTRYHLPVQLDTLFDNNGGWHDYLFSHYYSPSPAPASAGFVKFCMDGICEIVEENADIWLFNIGGARIASYFRGSLKNVKIWNKEVEIEQEICDGIDNDWDGDVDEGDNLCPLRYVCSEGVCVETGEEVCDGIDNDQDGKVDESAYILAEDGTSLERCKGFMPQTCVDGKWENKDPDTFLGFDFLAWDKGCESSADECIYKYVKKKEQVINLKFNGICVQYEDGIARCGNKSVSNVEEVCNGKDDNCDMKMDILTHPCKQCLRNDWALVRGRFGVLISSGLGPSSYEEVCLNPGDPCSYGGVGPLGYSLVENGLCYCKECIPREEYTCGDNAPCKDLCGSDGNLSLYACEEKKCVLKGKKIPSATEKCKNGKIVSTAEGHWVVKNIGTPFLDTVVEGGVIIATLRVGSDYVGVPGTGFKFYERSTGGTLNLGGGLGLPEVPAFERWTRIPLSRLNMQVVDFRIWELFKKLASVKEDCE